MRAFGRWMWVVGCLVIGCLAVPVAAQDNAECLDCHADPDLVREGEHRPGTSVYVSEEMGLDSVHEDWACVDCHVGVDVDHDWEALPPADCAGCHEDAADAVDASLHGEAARRGVDDVPTCADCHGGHDIRYVDDPESPAFRTNVPQTCAECHADPSYSERRPLARVSPMVGYEQSVHYKALMAGDEGATCTDCHEYHALLPVTDPQSTIHDQNVPATCGTCHGEIQAVYERSIHGQALAAGELDSPDCVDCHGEHEIRGPDDPKSLVYPAHVSETTCVWCHESERMVRRFGLAQGRGASFGDSYHGLANRGGSTTVANCASCHGIHDILPSSEPESKVHPDNLAATCGECHPGAGSTYAIGTVHVIAGAKGGGEHVSVYWARVIYLWLIVGVVGLMAAHNGLDFARKGRAPRLPRGRAVLRFSVSERWQHGIMAGSFLVLAYSGFALKFPEAWWAAPFSWFGQGEVVRQWVHRIAALAMVGVCLVHLAYVALTARGRGQLIAMLPRWQDVRDAAHMVGWYLHTRSDKPGFDRYGYIEKLEYWALVWGTIVMTVTGFSLWFENLSLTFLPLWALDLATVVHYYEAWLATLAIVVWHFYWVMFNPEIYPMSKVWLDGWLSEEEMKHEHPKEWERIQQQRREGGAEDR